MNQPSILYLTAMLMDLCSASVMFSIGRRAAELGANPLELGLLVSAVPGAYSACALVTGRISDRVGRRKSAVTGCIISGGMALACGYTTHIGVLLGLSVMFGGGMACFWPSIIAWLGEGVSGAALASRLTKFGMAWNVGMLLGFLISGSLFEQAPRLAFFMASTISLVNIALLMLPTKPPIDRPEASASETLPQVPKGRGFRKTAWLANFSLAFAIIGVSAIFPRLAIELGLRADTHGALVALRGGAALLTFWVMQYLDFWRTRLWPLWVVQAVCAAAIACIGLGTQIWFFALAFAAGGMAAAYTFQASLMFTLEEISEKGKGSGFHEAIVGSGMFLGPIIAGSVGLYTEVRTPFFFCAWFLLLSIVGQAGLVLWRRKRKRIGRVN